MTLRRRLLFRLRTLAESRAVLIAMSGAAAWEACEGRGASRRKLSADIASREMTEIPARPRRLRQTFFSSGMPLYS
jgi:hypothetical protein